VAGVDEREGRPDLLRVSLDDGLDDFVLGLEVVVDVARRDVGGLGDVGERRPFDALLVHELRRGGYQPLPFPRTAPGGGRRARY